MEVCLKNCKIINFNKFGDHKGSLVPIESKKDIPFDIKRIYYITNVPNDVTRGFHSHRNLEQVLICVNGSVKIRLSDSNKEEIVELSSVNKGLYIGHMIWREMFDFSEQAVLLVMASDYYNEDDYIRDYTEYKLAAETFF